MRTFSILAFAAVLALVSGVASAGNLTLANGKAQWQSSTCTEPTMPPSLLVVDKETSAGDMNTLMENYNAYANNMQSYMNCVSKEADADQTITNQAIVQSAEVSIGAAQSKVRGLHDALQAKH